MGGEHCKGRGRHFSGLGSSSHGRGTPRPRTDSRSRRRAHPRARRGARERRSPPQHSPRLIPARAGSTGVTMTFTPHPDGLPPRGRGTRGRAERPSLPSTVHPRLGGSMAATASVRSSPRVHPAPTGSAERAPVSRRPALAHPRAGGDTEPGSEFGVDRGFIPAQAGTVPLGVNVSLTDGDA